MNFCIFTNETSIDFECMSRNVWYNFPILSTRRDANSCAVVCPHSVAFWTAINGTLLTRSNAKANTSIALCIHRRFVHTTTVPCSSPKTRELPLEGLANRKLFGSHPSIIVGRLRRDTAAPKNWSLAFRDPFWHVLFSGCCLPILWLILLDLG